MSWDSCPNCGTKLPKLCAKCGEPIEELSSKCPHCGAEIESTHVLEGDIDSLRKSAEEDVAPETKASRYSKLAEVQLKAGENEAALDSYTDAISYTEFDRKRCYFMVRMASILNNMGREEEAIEILDEAIRLDPQDYAGAQELKDEILKPDDDMKEKSVSEARPSSQ